MRQKGFAPVLIIVLIAILGGLGYWGYKSDITTAPLFNRRLMSFRSSQNTDLTANWKTYTNSKYGYQLKYPSGYAADQRSRPSTNPEVVPNLVVTDEKSFAEYAPHPDITIDVLLDGEKGDLREMANYHYIEMKDLSLGPVAKDLFRSSGLDIKDNSQVVKFSEIVFRGKKAYTYTIRGSSIGAYKNSWISSSQDRTYIWVENKGEIILITFNNNQTNSQIISTFQFTQ